MNDVQKFVNGILRNHSMHKRYIAVLTALSMVVSIVVTSILVMPADSKAGSLICEKTEHIHDESCKKLVCGLDEVIYDEVTTEAVSQAIGQFVQLAQLEGETVGDAKTEASVEVTESYEVVEGTESIIEATEETVVSESASESAGEISEDTNEDTVPQVTESVQHIHTDECYMYVCGFEEHTHSEDCYESVEVDPTPDEVDSYMINQNAFDVFNVFGRPMHLLYNDVSATGEFSTENSPDSTMPVNPGAILGVATHFHVLAEEASFESHVHGNVATNYLVKCGAFGVYLNKLAGKSSVNYIRNFGEYAPLNNAFQTKLVLGSRYAVEQKENDNRYRVYEKDNPSNEFYIPIGNFPEGGSMNENVEINDNYINVTKELDKFADMSRAIAAKPSKGTVVNGDINNITDQVLITDDGGEKYILDFSKITDKYIYYTLDLTGNDKNNQPLINFSTCSKVLEIKGITEDKFLFLTVDVGNNENVAFNKSWRVYRADDQKEVYGTGEVPLDDGSCRVIYNIVNSTDSNGVKEYTPFGEKDGKPTDSKIILGEQKNGTFLVPRGYVNCAGNTNGTIIAYKYVATGESHRADIQFEDEEVDDVDCPTTSENVTESEGEGGESTTPEEKKISITVNKVWSDGIENGNHSGDNVTIQLYKGYDAKLDVTNNDLINNSTLRLVNGTNQITLNQGNNWTAKFEGLPVKEKMGDQTEKLIYYYIKEVDVTGYTATYSANGLNTVDRTVTVRNVKLMDLVIKKQWHKSDGTQITASDVDDNNNNILSSMPSVECTLYKSNIHLSNNLPTDAEVLETFSIGGNAWQYTKAQLPTEEDGKPLYYYVMEKPVDGYNVSYENVGYLGSNEIIVKNTQKASGTISLTVNKRWLATDIDGVIDYTSPVKAANIEVTVELQKSTDASNWVYVTEATFTTSYTFTNLPKHENNTAIYYRVKEKNVPYGYQDLYSKTSVKAQDVTDNGEVTITVTNTLIKNSLVINKNWHNGNSSGVSSIIVEVYRKLAGENNKPSINGTGESVPEDDPIVPPSQGENPNPDDSSTVQGTVDANGVLNFPEKEISQNDQICYDLSSYEGRMVKSVTIYSKPSEGSNDYNYNGMVTIGTQNRNYSGANSSSENGYTIDFENMNLIVGKEISSGITIKCLDVSSSCNLTHIITGIEVEFYDGWYDVSTGQKVSSFIRNNWLLFDSVSTDIVTYDEETNVLTVVPADGDFNETLWTHDVKRYDISAYKGKTIDNIVVTYNGVDSSSESQILLLVGDLEKSCSGKHRDGSYEWQIDNGYSLDDNYNIAIFRFTGTHKLSEIKITFKDEAPPPSDTVTFDSTNKILTVIPGDGSFSDLGEFKGWGYTIPSDYYDYNITNVKMTCSVSNPGSGAIYISSSNNGVFSWTGWNESQSGGTFNGNVIELSGINYSLSDYTEYGVYLRDDTNNYIVQKLEITFATKGTTPQYTQGNTTHNFTTNGTLSSFYNISGSLSTGKGTHYYNGLTLTQCLKINSDASISFSVSENNTGKLILVFGESNGKKFYIDNTSYTVDDDGIVEIDNLSPGSHTISKSSGDETNLFYMTYSETIVENQKKDEVSFVNNVLTVIPANAKGEDNKYKHGDNYFKNAWGYQIPSEHRGKTITDIKITFESSVNGAEIWILPNKDQGVMQAYWEGDTCSKSSSSSSSSFEWSNISYTIPTTYLNYSLYVIEVGDIGSDGNNSSKLQNYTITELKITFKSDEIIHKYKDIYLNNIDSSEFSVNNSEQYLLTNSELSEFSSKSIEKIELTYNNDLSSFPDSNTQTNLWIQGPNGYIASKSDGTSYLCSGKVATLVYDPVAVSSLNEIRIKTAQASEINNIKVRFTDGSTYTVTNKCSGIYNTTSKNDQIDVTIAGDNNDNASIVNLNNYPLSDYKGKYLDYIQVYLKNSYNEVPAESLVNLYIRKAGDDYGVVPQISRSQNGNITTYNYGGVATHDAVNLRSDFFRLKTTINTEIQKVVLVFSDNSTFTMNNSNYDSTTSEEEQKIEYLERDITITESLYGSELDEKYGYWVDSTGAPNDTHEGFGFYNEHKNAYADKYFNSVQIYYRDMLLGFPDYQKDTKVYLLRHSEINGDWCPEQTGYDFDDNVATWLYGGDETASDLASEFFWIKTSRPDEISKVVICFTDGSTYTMNNTAYVASSKVESSEDDYTYNTGEYVLIAKITLTADGGWRQTLDNLPATDGQGNAYTYHIKETNIYGSDADKYKVLSYTHANGIVLENDSNNIGVTNERKADENINVLPNTGSTGAKGYFVAGIIVMICSAAGYTVIKRRLIR
ncbi:MAG: Cna B-type domain-containing protein [Ruminococcus sp.]|nr:Cna B-type domain-containing protein [Ruminococcus sp.]